MTLEMAMAILTAFADVSGPTTGFYLDLLNLQWWQGLIGILGVLGLSPAPWLLGLAINRIQFSLPARKDFERQAAEAREDFKRQLTDKDAGYEKALTSVKENAAAQVEMWKARYDDAQDALRRERGRADEVTDAALDLGKVLEANTHVMGSITELAKEREAESNDR